MQPVHQSADQESKPHRKHLVRRRGFSMVEVVVALGLMAVLAGIVLPRVAGYLDSQRVDATATIFDDLANSVRAFKTTVTKYPGRLSDLSNVPASTDLTACGAGFAYGATAQGNWKNAAPYYPRTTSKTGFPLPIGTANDVLTRTSSAASGQMIVTVPNVKTDDARDLNAVMDGDADQVNGSNTTGQIQWANPPSAGVVTLTYRIPVASAC